MDDYCEDIPASQMSCQTMSQNSQKFTKKGNVRKTRDPNYQIQEEIALVNAMEVHSEIIVKKHDNSITNRRKLQAWMEVLKAVNAVSPYVRSVESVKKKWEAMKARAKKNNSLLLNDMLKTGGGPPLNVQKAVWENKVLMIMGETCIYGLKGGFDSLEPMGNGGQEEEEEEEEDEEKEEEPQNNYEIEVLEDGALDNVILGGNNKSIEICPLGNSFYDNMGIPTMHSTPQAVARERRNSEDMFMDEEEGYSCKEDEGESDDPEFVDPNMKNKKKKKMINKVPTKGHVAPTKFPPSQKHDGEKKAPKVTTSQKPLQASSSILKPPAAKKMKNKCSAKNNMPALPPPPPPKAIEFEAKGPSNRKPWRVSDQHAIVLIETEMLEINKRKLEIKERRLAIEERRLQISEERYEREKKRWQAEDDKKKPRIFGSFTDSGVEAEGQLFSTMGSSPI